MAPAREEETAGEKKFGVLEEVKPESEEQLGSTFPDYKPATSESIVDGAIERGFSWNSARANPVAHGEFPLYFYYTFERAASLEDQGDESWFTYYGDGLLTLQQEDGSFKGKSRAVADSAATSFAILYFMRSTKQIIDKVYGTGTMKGGRDLAKLMNPDAEKKKDFTPLDDLLNALEGPKILHRWMLMLKKLSNRFSMAVEKNLSVRLRF